MCVYPMNLISPLIACHYHQNPNYSLIALTVISQDGHNYGRGGGTGWDGEGGGGTTEGNLG